jgi:hypothetical protein
VYWFAALERAIEEGDFQKAAHAQRELDRLGVKVRYRCKADTRQEAPRGE